MRRISNERLQHISDLNPTSDLGECAREILAYRAYGMPDEIAALRAELRNRDDEIQMGKDANEALRAENERLRAELRVSRECSIDATRYVLVLDEKGIINLSPDHRQRLDYGIKLLSSALARKEDAHAIHE
jgi:hypothetical protein